MLMSMAQDFDADFERGLLYWVKPRKGKKEAGTFKSALNRHTVIYKNKVHLRYRILFALFNGYWPFGEIDHIDGNSLNDSISNLRDGDRKLNAKNTKIRSDNKTGMAGISFHQGKWRVRLSNKHIGSFEKKSEAMAVRLKVQLEEGYTQRHGT